MPTTKSKSNIKSALIIFLHLINQITSQKCIFGSIRKSDWEPNFYACILSSNSDQMHEIHMPYRSNDDVTVITSSSDANFGNLDVNFCQRLKNIEIIELRNSGIESISDKLLKNCNNLKLADFSENKIQKIPENLFSQNLKIFEIALGGNNLTILPENLFKNLSNLEILTLHDNKINVLPPKIFNSLENLRELYLDNNKIKILDSNLFKNLKKLENLYLNSNEILDLPENIFANLTNLRTLVLKNNFLSTIHEDSFGGLENLRNVDLSFNNISSIDEKFIDNTGVTVLMMENSFCTNNNAQNKIEIKKILKFCFENYEPRGDGLSVKSSFDDHLTTSNDDFKCGKPVDVTIRSRIIDGSQVELGDFPWSAILITSDGDYQCGGTLISSFKVVTAAHCVTSPASQTITSPVDRKVLLGVYDFDNQNETDRQTHSISEIIVHPEWKFLVNLSYDADVAVLKLSTEVKFTSYIRPICLMKPFTFLETITDGIVVGYGKSEDESKDHENIARLIKIPIHNNEHCLLSHAVIREMSSNRTFCGGYANGTGVCRGDSGSGLIVFFNQTYYLRGIVSGSIWGDKYECDVHNYAVFADLTKFYKWIMEGILDPEPTKEQKIERLLHQIMALGDGKWNLEFVKRVVDEKLNELNSIK